MKNALLILLLLTPALFADDSGPNPRYWNFFRVRGSSELDVALFNYGQLLEVHGGGKLNGFEIAGKDRQFKPATATIGGQITEDEKLNVTWINLKSAQVKEPWYIRYAHGAYRSKANLANGLGDKALPFQTQPSDPASE